MRDFFITSLYSLILSLLKLHRGQFFRSYPTDCDAFNPVHDEFANISNNILFFKDGSDPRIKKIKKIKRDLLNLFCFIYIL